MTNEERFNRLESAMAVLAEQSARHGEKMEELAALAGRSERREQTLMDLAADFRRLLESHEGRISDRKRLLEILTEKSLGHDADVEELRAAQADAERRIAALADAQIRTEDKFSELAAAQAETDRKMAVLAESQARTDEKFAALAGSQAHSDGKLDALIDVVRDLLEGRRPGGGRAAAGTAEKD